MPSTTTYRRGPVVVVNVTFTGQTGEKKLIKRVLGTLHAEDLARVQHGLREALGL